MPSIQIEGSILSLNELGVGKSKRLVAKFSDGSSQIDLVWFKQIKWIQSSINLKKIMLSLVNPIFLMDLTVLYIQKSLNQRSTQK